MTTATIYPGVVIDVGASGLVGAKGDKGETGAAGAKGDPGDLSPAGMAASTAAVNAASTATTQAGIATTQAGIATTGANTATTQAGIATTQAGIATTRAGEAATSATTAATQASTATTQAGIATTQAGIATTQANTATAQATTATNQANAAANSAAQAALLGAVFGPGMIFNHTDQSIPTGWWDTGLRQTVTDSIWSTTSTLALISNWSVASLYTGGIATAFFDFTTAARLFQGILTTPVTTAGQSIASARDAITPLTLGPELVTNGTFDVDANWTKGGGWTISGGQAVRVANAGRALDQNISLVAGRTYRVTGDVTVSAGDFTPIFIGGTTVNGAAVSATGSFEQYMTAATGNVTFRISGQTTSVGTVDNVSVREVQGIVATQPSASLRPLWRNDPLPAGGLSRGAARFDLVDDTLTFNLPAAVDGELWFAGRSGTWRETRLAASGATVTVGPTGTLATPGLLRAVGDVVAMGFRAGTMTADEWLRLKRRYRAEGAKGELIAGADALGGAGSFASATGFTLNTGWSIAGGVATHAAGTQSDLVMPGSVTAGAPHLLIYDVVAVRAAGAVSVAGNAGTYTTVEAVPTVGTGKRLVFVPSVTGQPRIRVAAAGDIDFDNVTVQPLTPEW